MGCCGSREKGQTIQCANGCGRLGNENYANMCIQCANEFRTPPSAFSAPQLSNQNNEGQAGYTSIPSSFPMPPPLQVMCGNCSNLVAVPPGWQPGVTVQVRCPSCSTVLAVPPQVLATFTQNYQYQHYGQQQHYEEYNDEKGFSTGALLAAGAGGLIGGALLSEALG